MGHTGTPRRPGLIRRAVEHAHEKLQGQPREVVETVTPYISQSYLQGACDVSVELLGLAKNTGDVQQVITRAANLVAQCHGADPEQKGS